MSKQYSDVLGYFFWGGACAEAKKALRSVQFFASFISFYFEILSYLACGKKIIRLASKNSVKLVEKSTSERATHIMLMVFFQPNKLD